MKVYIESCGDHSVGEWDFRAIVDLTDTIETPPALSLRDTHPQGFVLMGERMMTREALRTAFAAMWPVEWHTIDVRFEDECPDCRMYGGQHAANCPSREAPND